MLHVSVSLNGELWKLMKEWTRGSHRKGMRGEDAIVVRIIFKVECRAVSVTVRYLEPCN